MKYLIVILLCLLNTARAADIKQIIVKANSGLDKQQALRIANAITLYSMVNGLDATLLAAVIMTESSFRVDAVGSQGEVGLMQLRPEFHSHNNTLEDPIRNIAVGARYLRQIKEQHEFEYSKLKWLELYNRGPNSKPKTFKYSNKVKVFYSMLKE